MNVNKHSTCIKIKKSVADNLISSVGNAARRATTRKARGSGVRMRHAQTIFNPPIGVGPSVQRGLRKGGAVPPA